MKTIKIKEDFQIPGTDILLEAGDNIQVLNESYGNELDQLQKVFDKVALSMRGSSISDPREIWIDLGVRNRFCDENGRLL